MGYPVVHIVNSTNYTVKGVVTYEGSLVCSPDNYGIGTNGTWQAKTRGLCLVTNISAAVTVNGKTVTATPYTSSGTTYSQFAVVAGADAGSFSVTRVDD